MSSGSSIIKVLTDGTLMMDGGTAFGQVPKTEWETHIKCDRRNRIRLGINTLVVKTPHSNILVDTGAGSKRTDSFKDSHSINGNKLLRGLKEVGLNSREIDVVILTDLHFDHSGGCTKLSRDGTPVPIFPNAKHIVQESCWDEATSPNERYENSFYSDDFMPVEEKGLLELISGDREITNGIKVRLTDGPSKGHQIVFVDMGGEKVVFAGDLIPTEHHLNLEYIAASDEFPNETLVQKKELLDMAMNEGWLIVFGHGQEHKSGYVENWNGKAHLLPKEV